MKKTLLKRIKFMLRIASLAKSFMIKIIKTSYYIINQSTSATFKIKHQYRYKLENQDNIFFTCI